MAGDTFVPFYGAFGANPVPLEVVDVVKGRGVTMASRKVRERLGENFGSGGPKAGKNRSSSGGKKKISRTEKIYRKAQRDRRFAKMTGANARPFERKIARIESNRGIARTKR